MRSLEQWFNDEDLQSWMIAVRCLVEAGPGRLDWESRFSARPAYAGQALQPFSPSALQRFHVFRLALTNSNNLSRFGPSIVLCFMISSAAKSIASRLS